MPSSKKHNGLLARVNFPLYTIQMVSDRHVLVGGGGGSAKTGVLNGFEIFELTKEENMYCAKEVIRHETGPKVVMNSACISDKKSTYLVAGQESHCQLYKIGISVERESQEAANGEVKNSGLRNRKHENGITEPGKKDKKVLKFKFIIGDSVQTDFSEKEPCQRVVALSRCSEWMATGGADGIVRVWSFPGMRLSKILKSHTKELDDIHFSPDSKQIVSVAKDGLAIVWDLRTGKQLHSLTWTHPAGVKYLFKRCRFGGVESRGCRLFTTSNPIGNGKEASGWLHSWDEGRVSKSTTLPEPTSALAVRDDGTFLAIGTMFTGSIHIYIAFSLQKVHQVEGVHSMFVTGLEMLPSTCTWDTSEAAVLSISVDNKVCIQSVPYRRTLPPWLAIILLIITVLTSFIICSYLGL